jgi:PPOX class probable F420-dependent enzyme
VSQKLSKENQMTFTIPESHKDLIEQPIVATLATITPNGKPHTAVIWRFFDGSHILFITSRHLQKAKNIQANPQVSLMVIDPQNPGRYLEIRGVVDEITEEGALHQLDKMTKFYTNKSSYYGDIVPAENKGTRTHIICKIKPIKVITR